jgi:ABC-type amino acid transport system, permease component
MRESTGICSIILPQAMRLSIPGWANEFSILLKDSAICFVLGTQDIMARTSFVAARTHEHLALYATAGVLYFVLTLVVLKLLRLLEQKIPCARLFLRDRHGRHGYGISMSVDQQAVLQVKGISKMLGGKPILDNCSLTVNRGELKVLIGPSGAGKSTFLQSINCLIPPESGEIYLKASCSTARTRPHCAPFAPRLA